MQVEPKANRTGDLAAILLEALRNAGLATHSREVALAAYQLAQVAEKASEVPT